MKRIQAPILLLTALVSAAIAGAQASGSSGSALSSSGNSSSSSENKAKKFWNIGFVRLTGRNLSPGAASLADVIPRLVMNELHFLPPYRVQAETSAIIADLKAVRSRFGAGADLAARLDEKAALFLTPTISGPKRSVEIASLEKRLVESGKKFELALVEDSKRSSEISSLPARFWDGKSGNEIIDPAEGTAAAIAKARNIDFVLSGTLEEIGGYILVLFSGYDSSTERRMLTWKGYCSLEDPGPLAQDFGLFFERWIAGRDYGRLEIAASPASARITVDGVQLDAGENVIFRFDAGMHEIRVEAVGRKSQKAEIILDLGERRAIEFALDEASTGKAEVSSDPQGASVSIDSVPMGSTPITIPLDGRKNIVSLDAPGRERSTIVLPSEGQTSITVTLPPADGLGPGGRVAKNRDEFYAALGWFVLSLPITALAAGNFGTYSDAASRSGDAGLFTRQIASGAVLGAAATATATFAVNFIIRLVRYLGSAR